MGFVLAALSGVFLVFAAIPAIVIGIVCLTRTRVPAGTAIIAIAVALPVFVLAVVEVRAFRQPSESMVPTLDLGDRFLTTSLGSPGRGDIIAFNPPAGADDNACGTRHPEDSVCPRGTAGRSESNFVKRIVAVGGDRVAIRDGRPVVNGQLQNEPYIRAASGCSVCDLPVVVTIPDDHFFVLGDNRGESADSRDWGPVPADAVTGKVTVRYWPLGDAGMP